MTIQHTQESTRFTKGFRTFWTMLTKSGKGITKVVDKDGSVFEMLSEPIKDPVALKAYRIEQGIKLAKGLGKAGGSLGLLCVAGACTPYLFCSIARAYSNVRSVQKGDVEDGSCLAGVYKLGGAKAKVKIIVGQIGKGFIPDRSDVNMGLDILKGTLVYHSVLLGSVGIACAATIKTDDGSKWEIQDKSGKRIPWQP